MNSVERAELHRRIKDWIAPRGTPLGAEALRLRGQPCPLGLSSDYGYTKHNCRCDGCREGHRVRRLARLHRSKL